MPTECPCRQSVSADSVHADRVSMPTDKAPKSCGCITLAQAWHSYGCITLAQAWHSCITLTGHQRLLLVTFAILSSVL